jgi:hypothetical protein
MPDTPVKVADNEHWKYKVAANGVSQTPLHHGWDGAKAPQRGTDMDPGGMTLIRVNLASVLLSFHTGKARSTPWDDLAN